MTSKTSLFSLGIFKTTLRRFMWGSIAYFAMLFMSTCFPIMMEEEYQLVARYQFTTEPLLFVGDYVVFPILTAIAVPLVVSLLIFRFIHSKGQNIFTHSLPVSRGANYVSSLLAGFVLMAVPVILNGIGLYILHFSYSKLIEPYHCFLWTAIVLFALFVMFSIAVFASVLTGNSFMAVFLYGATNALPLVLVGMMEAIGMYFVSGYSPSGILFDNVVKYTPISWIVNYGIRYEVTEHIIPVVCYIAMAVVLYIATYLLYRIRKSEKTGEVAAFRLIGPMLKYLITTGVAILMYAILLENYRATLPMYIIFLPLSTLVAYFACEMVLRKSVRVFKTYKGYIGFWAVSIVMIALIHFTGCFGYSTRVPDKEDVKTVQIYAYYYETSAYSSMPEAIDYVINLHNEYKHTPARVVNDNYTRLYIEYELKDGSEMERMYYVPYETGEKVNKEMYSFEDYKQRYNTALNIEMDEVKVITVYSTDSNVETVITSPKEIREFLEILKEETNALDYYQVYTNRYDNYLGFELNDKDQKGTTYRGFDLSDNHTKSIEWINEWRKNNQ